MKDKKEDDHLLYTLVNGQVNNSQGTSLDLSPGSSVDEVGLTKKQRKKQKKHLKSQSEYFAGLPSPDYMEPRNISENVARQQQPTRLPTNASGKLDVDRLTLPPGISITKIEGPVPERKYFPSLPEPTSTQPLDIPKASGTFGITQRMAVVKPGAGVNLVSAFSGGGVAPASHPTLPNGGSGANVIVVDTNSLKTRADELEPDGGESEIGKKAKKAKKMRRKKQLSSGNVLAATTMDYCAAKKLLGPSFMSAPSQIVTAAPSAPSILGERNLSMFPRPSVLDPPPPPQQQQQRHEASPSAAISQSDNSLKKGPQVLIKNINGKVVITPIVETYGIDDMSVTNENIDVNVGRSSEPERRVCSSSSTAGGKIILSAVAAAGTVDASRGKRNGQEGRGRGRQNIDEISEYYFQSLS
jgi:hypothetical protein